MFESKDSQNKNIYDENFIINEDDEKKFFKTQCQTNEDTYFKTFQVIDTRSGKLIYKKVFKFEYEELSIEFFKFLHKIRHPCICQLLYINLTGPTISFYFEYAKYSINQVINKKIDNTFKAKIVLEVTHAMNFLHKQQIIHGNLTIDNIMINSSKETKILDIGLSKINKDPDQIHFGAQGISSLIFKSPEILNEECYDNKTDVYSFGVLLYYIFMERLPKIMIRDVINGKPIQFPSPSDSISQFCIELIKQCMIFNPSERPSFANILDQLRSNAYCLASGVDRSILSNRDIELDNFNEIQSIEVIEINFNNFLFNENYLIKEGEYYQTYLIEAKNSKNRFAANVFYQNFEDYPDKSKLKIYDIIKKKLRVDHPFIIKCFDLYENKYSVLISELVNNENSLEFVIKNEGKFSNKRPINLAEKLINIFGIASAMSYLHSNDILHFDLKPCNIIEDENFHPKLINYGLKTVFRSINDMKKMKDFTFYNAPEFYINNEYSKKSEVYSFALISYELLTCKSLFENITFIDHLKNIHSKYQPQYNSNIPPSLWKLIEICWSQNPNDRPTFDDIVNELTNNKKLIAEINSKEYNEFIQSFKFKIKDPHDSNKNEKISFDYL